ncbi:MAG: hypothetical protein HY318_08445 [Armatimonadetes bacterium]|nr:hypothetical protein [Armatimonadota bacterium]
MHEFAILTSDRTLQLPAEVYERFLPSDRFIVWMDGEALHLKRIAPSPLKVVEQSPTGEPISLDEINEIVHEVPRQRRDRKAE